MMLGFVPQPNLRSSAIAVFHIGVARKRNPSACTTLRTVANSGLPSIDMEC
ncbi:hypothetical protein [Crocosphaera sp. XPORK-15E]|uniref:hypothetical protein n=1 Tax=Crocosphaera sp. XPORK-15E TaxID=3110247 RepID=UPI002B21AA39|nr:hypothetical protein [Crocosphaera sp. XPORK-15E]MEA5533613.1 hypothetical protein [Crocosphaera sp. XPORK-15E]